MFTSQCPACGLAKTEWIVNKGEGFPYDDMMYCCRGCAEDIGCTCQDIVAAHDRRNQYRRKDR